MKTYKNHFKSFETFKKAIRNVKKDEWADWLKIGKHWYTCEEFDEEGKNMRFTSITEQMHIDINTSNRYSENWLKDAEVEQYKVWSYRFNPAYYIEKEEFIKLSVTDKTILLDHIQKTFDIRHATEFILDYCNI